MKKKKNDNKRVIRIVLAILIILILCLLLLINNLKKSTNEEPHNTTINQSESEEIITNRVRNRGEKERMQIYLSEFLKNIERKEYTIAYNKLYPEFKANFFRTEEQFIKFAHTYYSDFMSIEYEDVQREGTYYILTVVITHLQDPQTTMEQTFIIREAGLNDYQVSFQVKDY